VGLADDGVLFLDTLPGIRSDALESRRQPIEDGLVALARATACAPQGIGENRWSHERIRSALKNSGFSCPAKRSGSG